MSADLVTAYGWQGVVLLAWVGLSVGSFLNVVIYRFPVMLKREWREQAREILAEAGEPIPAADGTEEPFNLMVPRSRCPHCGHQIRAWENIPVISWIILRARCSNCAAPIAWRYPAIELLTGIATVAAVALFGFTWMGLAVCFFTWMLIALTFIDYDTKLLPDQITYPLLWLGLLTNGLLAGVVPLADAMIGAVAGYLSLWLTYWGFKLATGKEGMGYGDFKLLAALGAWMGWQALASIILIAAALGLVYALALKLFSASTDTPEAVTGGEVPVPVSEADSSIPAGAIPFGPFLAAAGWVTMMFRDTVLAVFLP